MTERGMELSVEVPDRRYRLGDPVNVGIGLSGDDTRATEARVDLVREVSTIGRGFPMEFREKKLTTVLDTKRLEIGPQLDSVTLTLPGRELSTLACPSDLRVFTVRWLTEATLDRRLARDVHQRAGLVVDCLPDAFGSDTDWPLFSPERLDGFGPAWRGTGAELRIEIDERSVSHGSAVTGRVLIRNSGTRVLYARHLESALCCVLTSEPDADFIVWRDNLWSEHEVAVHPGTDETRPFSFLIPEGERAPPTQRAEAERDSLPSISWHIECGLRDSRIGDHYSGHSLRDVTAYSAVHVYAPGETPAHQIFPCLSPRPDRWTPDPRESVTLPW